MIKIFREKGGGKTDELIKISNNTKDVIVCMNINDMVRVKSRARHLKLSIPQPITYSDFINKNYLGRNISGFLIDNIEELLNSISYIPINAITLTKNQSFSFSG